MKKFRKTSKNKIETNLIYFYFLLASKSSKSKIKTLSKIKNNEIKVNNKRK